jgi:hypothetical protein
MFHGSMDPGSHPINHILFFGVEVHEGYVGVAEGALLDISL